MLWQAKYELISLVTQTARKGLPTSAQIVAYQQTIAGRLLLLEFSLCLSHRHNKFDLSKPAQTPSRQSKP